MTGHSSVRPAVGEGQIVAGDKDPILGQSHTSAGLKAIERNEVSEFHHVFKVIVLADLLVLSALLAQFPLERFLYSRWWSSPVHSYILRRLRITWSTSIYMANESGSSPLRPA